MLSLIILANIFSELTSIIVLFLFLPKKFKIYKQDFIPNKSYTKEVLDISLPSTGSRIIGNIGHFFEPIIITYVLLKIGYSHEFILTEYGIITGYVMPFINAIIYISYITCIILTVSHAYVEDIIIILNKNKASSIFFQY